MRRGPVLGAWEENPFRAAGSFRHSASFANGQRERLRHIDVLAGFEAQHRGDGVPVIRGGFHDGVHFLDLEQTAKVP